MHYLSSGILVNIISVLRYTGFSPQDYIESASVNQLTPASYQLHQQKSAAGKRKSTKMHQKETNNTRWWATEIHISRCFFIRKCLFFMFMAFRCCSELLFKIIAVSVEESVWGVQHAWLQHTEHLLKIDFCVSFSIKPFNQTTYGFYKLK